MNLQIPIQLREAMKANQLVLFLGAGVSRFVDEELPGRNQFLLRLARHARLSFQEKEALERTLQKQGGFRQYLAADFIAHRLGKKKLLECSREILKANREGVKNLKSLRPLHSMKFRFAITTNYDTVIERSAALASQKGRAALHTYTHRELEAVLGSIRHGRQRFLFKIHGDLSQGSPDEREIVLSLDSYYKSISDARYLALMHAIFLNHTVLFLGYSLDDYDFNYIFSTVALLMQNSRQKHYALVPPPETDVVTEEVMKAYGIEIIPGDLKSFFQSLGQVDKP
jgi:hypothetical protein